MDKWVLGTLQNDPVLCKGKNGNDCVRIYIVIKRPKNQGQDIFVFLAYGETAEYILQCFHSGDCVLVNTRQKRVTVFNCAKLSCTIKKGNDLSSSERFCVVYFDFGQREVK